MAKKELDLKGLKCPVPQLKMSQAILTMEEGDVLEVVADCDTFEDDVRRWCERAKVTLLWFRDKGEGVKTCQVQL